MRSSLFVYRHSAVQSHHRRNKASFHKSFEQKGMINVSINTALLKLWSFPHYLTRKKKLISSNINISSVLKSNYFRKICLKLLFFSFQALKKRITKAVTCTSECKDTLKDAHISHTLLYKYFEENGRLYREVIHSDFWRAS